MRITLVKRYRIRIDSDRLTTPEYLDIEAEDSGGAMGQALDQASAICPYHFRLTIESVEPVSVDTKTVDALNYAS